mgnify:CR=1 FL=1|jgi:uncharacterized protein
MSNKLYLSWSDIDELIRTLCINIIEYQKKNNIQFQDIFGIQRGGLIPAVIVSHQLGIPMTKGTITSNTLIIDDICDSGLTLADFYEEYQDSFDTPINLTTACLHYKPHTSVFTPHIYAQKWEKDDWIVYAWERNDAEAIQDYMKDWNKRR